MDSLSFKPLSAKGIKHYLPDSLKDIPIFTYDIIDSTNNECKRIAFDSPYFAVAAEGQTAGRGRQGKSFYSPSGAGLYLSIAVKPSLCGINTQMITLAAAVAVSRAIEEVTGLSTQIKWVNDLYLNGLKVCGILTEAVNANAMQAERVVIGIGINCTTVAFPEELSGIAGALSAPLSRNALAAAVLKNILIPIGDTLHEYRRRSFLTGKDITYTVNGHKFSAKVTGIGDNGDLLVRNSDGTDTRLHSGEVSLIRKAD